MGCGVSFMVLKNGEWKDMIYPDDTFQNELLSQYNSFRFSTIRPLSIRPVDGMQENHFTSYSPTNLSGEALLEENEGQQLEETDFNIVDNDRTLIQDIRRLLWCNVELLSGAQKLTIHNNFYYDLCLIVSIPEGKKYVAYAHAAIMSARSLYFSALISSCLSNQSFNIGINRSSIPNFNTLFDNMIELELVLPRVVQDFQSFLIVLEFIYCGYFVPSFIKRFCEWSDNSNLSRLLEILSLAHEYQLKSLQKICLYHISRVVSINIGRLSDFTNFVETLCPNLTINMLNLNVKVKLDVEGAFKDSYRMVRNLLPSPSQLKSQLENDFEKMYIRCNTSNLNGIAFNNYSDVRFTLYIDRHSFNTSGSDSAPSFIVSGNQRQTTRKTFRVHKLILCARSDYFSNYFWNANTGNTVTLPSGTDLNVIKALVHFIYTDRLKETDVQIIKELLSLAKHYRISRLKQLCMMIILKNMNKYNAIEEFYYIDQLDDEELRLLSLYKLASLYPRLSLDLTSSLDSSRIKNLNDTLKVLYRRLNNCLIWKRSAAGANTLDKIVPRKIDANRKKGRRMSLYNLTIGVIGTGRGCGVKTITQMMHKISEKGIYIDGVGVDIQFQTCNEQSDQQRRDMHQNFDGFILMFSLIDRETFNNIGPVYNSIQQKNKAMIMVGNKNDLIVGVCTKTPCVDAKEAINTAKMYKLSYIETNAKIGTNCTECIIQLVKEIFLQLQISSHIERVPRSSVNL